MINQQQAKITNVAELSFASGRVGARSRLEGAELARHGEQLGLHTRPLTQTNTADCGDERLTLRLADGTDDPNELRNRIVPQMFGGIGLSTTKALVAANAVIVRDAKNFWEAYEITTKHLSEEVKDSQGQYYEDGGHEGCGASGSVESSVANLISAERVVPALELFLPAYEDLARLADENNQMKYRRLQSGFYSGWDPQKHVDFLTSKFPQNFSYLKTDDSETHGHHGSSVYVVTQEGQGFAKNAFIEDTGQEAFAVTAPKFIELANKLGGSDKECRQIAVAFVQDTLDVGAGIVCEDFPVFVQKTA